MPTESTLETDPLRINPQTHRFGMNTGADSQAVLASCASAFTAALPTGFLGAALAMPCETAFSTAFSVKPFFTAFLTAFSTFLAAFFFALLSAIVKTLSRNLVPRLGIVHGQPYRRGRPAFLTAFFATFFAGAFFTAFLVAPFAATFFAGVFLTAFFAATFFAGAFWTAFLTVAFFAGDFVRTSVTVVTTVPTAVLTDPATSSVIAIPNPTASAAFSTIVFSATLRPLNLCVHVQSRIVEAYRGKRTNLLFPFQIVPPQCLAGARRLHLQRAADRRNSATSHRTPQAFRDH